MAEDPKETGTEARCSPPPEPSHCGAPPPEPSHCGAPPPSKCSTPPPSSCSTPPPTNCYTPPKSAAAVHVCAGLNGCAGLGKDGTGTMPGDGTCATVEHICHTHNDCRGQGGCGYEGLPMEQAYPGAQYCRTWGSCASPINASRITTLGPFKGRRTWEVARMRFEQRMRASGTEYAPAPREGAPDDYVPPYVVNDGKSCGNCSTAEAARKEVEVRARVRTLKALHEAT